MLLAGYFNHLITSACIPEAKGKELSYHRETIYKALSMHMVIVEMHIINIAYAQTLNNEGTVITDQMITIIK